MLLPENCRATIAVSKFVYEVVVHLKNTFLLIIKIHSIRMQECSMNTIHAYYIWHIGIAMRHAILIALQFSAI